MINHLYPIYNAITKRWWDGHQHELHGLYAVQTDQVSSNFTDVFSFSCDQTHRSHSYGVFYGENPLNYSFDVFLIEMVVITFITRTIRFILKPLGTPKFVSEMLGGMVIGPSVLCGENAFCQNVFPENSKFVMRNVGMIGFLYFLFVAGVEIDILFIRNVGRKHVYVAAIGSIVPFLATCAVGLYHRSSMGEHSGRLPVIGLVSAYLAVTVFPVVHVILKEMNLLSSEVGRMAVLSALIGDSVGVLCITLFDAFKESNSSLYALWYIISLFILGGLLCFCVTPAMFWIVNRTPEGKPVNQTYVTIILLGVLVFGFITDMFGLGLGSGAFWYGIAVPPGPPLGSTLVDRCKILVSDLLLPFGFAFIGQLTDVYAIAANGWSSSYPLLAMIATGYFTKVVSTFLVALYFRLPWRESLALSLIMNLRGHIDITIFLHWLDRRVIFLPMFSVLLLSTTLCTGISTYFINILYDPTRPYMVNKRRTIQHSLPGTELRLLVCIPDEECFSGLVNLLEVSYPTETGPFIIYALRLIQLVGRATPIFIDHEKRPDNNFTLHSYHLETIQNAFNQYEDARIGYVKVNLYTTFAAKRSMYQDVCKLALEKKANLIIIPFNGNVAGTELASHVHKACSLNAEIISHAPCSVALLVEKERIAQVITTKTVSRQNIVLLFLGGADSREALAYTDRMATNPDVTLMVIRFLAINHEGYDEMERRLDDGVMTWFWVKNEGNGRMFYREVIVKSGEDTLYAIQALDLDNIDLWVVGRQEGVNPVLLDGLTDWTQNPDLGLVGDFLASVDFGSTASVLVVHQQVMRGEK